MRLGFGELVVVARRFRGGTGNASCIATEEPVASWKRGEYAQYQDVLVRTVPWVSR